MSNEIKTRPLTPTENEEKEGREYKWEIERD